MICATITQIRCNRDCTQADLTYNRRSYLSSSSAHERNSENSISTERRSFGYHGGPYAVETGFPWDCGKNTTWRDLGESFYPRYISEVVCHDTACWYGHYRCKPVYQTIKVLRINQEHCRDTTLPVSLRQDWLLADINISVFCECGR